MTAALSTVNRDAARPVDELRAKLMAGWPRNRELQSEFGWMKVTGHQQATLAAHTAIFSLKRVVDDVERSGWPGNATQPKSTD